MLAALMPPRPKAMPRQFTLTEQSHALNIVLRKEFGIPFVFYHASTGAAVPDRISGPSDSWSNCNPDALPAYLPPEEVMRLAADTQPEVTILAHGRYQLTMIFYDNGKPLVVAAGLFVGLAKTGNDTEREQTWLQQWLESVSERLRLTEQITRQQRSTDDQHSQAKSAWEGLLAVDQVVRRLRIHKEPTRNRQRILEAAHGVLGSQALVWVSKDPNAAMQVAGEPCLSQLECRNLTAVLAKNSDLQANGHLLCHQTGGTDFKSVLPPSGTDFKSVLSPSGTDFKSVLPPSGTEGQSVLQSFPALTSLLAFAINDVESPGYVLALNKKGGSEGRSREPSGASAETAPHFRRGDAALLTPFVALLRLHAGASARYLDLKDLMVGMARSLTSAIDAKDSYTYGHSERVARIGVELGRGLGLEGDDLSDIYLSGLLHDVGKIGIRDDVLRKVDPLTTEEFEHIKQHVTIGYTILADLKPIRNLLPGVLYHHERWDGKGYPDGLSGEGIPLLARILAVADAYDAMSTNRPYRESIPCREVEERLTKGAGTQWDARVVDAFQRCRQKIRAIRQRGVGESLRTALDAALRTDDIDNSVVL